MITVYQLDSNKAEELFENERFSPFMYGMSLTKEDILKQVKNYVRVADLLTVDLDRAFEIGNIGPEEYYIRHRRMHSVSVGDILVKENGTAYVVAPAGFDELGLDIMEAA